MATIIEKTESNGETKKYILLGAGRVSSNFGSKEEAFITVCDNKGCISILTDYHCNLKVVDIDGEKPENILIN